MGQSPGPQVLSSELSHSKYHTQKSTHSLYIYWKTEASFKPSINFNIWTATSAAGCAYARMTTDMQGHHTKVVIVYLNEGIRGKQGGHAIYTIALRVIFDWDRVEIR